MPETSLDDSKFYFFRDHSDLEPEAVDYRSLMAHYDLEKPLEELRSKELPSTYSHLLRGVGQGSSETSETKGGLAALLDGVPFDRPIEPIPEHVLKSALQLPPASKRGPKYQTDGKKSGLVHPPPSGGSDGRGKRPRDDAERREKKEKKKRKREKETATILQKVLAPLVNELRALTWEGWVVNGKPANPFLQKITKENCKRLGVPNYFDFVQAPMDLTRMKEKVERAEYIKIDQFTTDVHLMVHNAKTFNRIGEPVHEMAVEMEQLYHQKVPSYQQTFESLLQERKRRKKEKKKKKVEKKKGTA